MSSPCSRARSAPTKAISWRPTAMTSALCPVWAITVSQPRACSRPPGARSCSRAASWPSAVIALRTVTVPSETAAAMIWFLGGAHRWDSFAVRDASAGSRCRLCSSSHAAAVGAGGWSTTARDSACPTRAQSSCTANASRPAALAADLSLPVRHSWEGSLAIASVAAVRYWTASWLSASFRLATCSTIRPVQNIRRTNAGQLHDECRCKHERSAGTPDQAPLSDSGHKADAPTSLLLASAASGSASAPFPPAVSRTARSGNILRRGRSWWVAARGLPPSQYLRPRRRHSWTRHAAAEPRSTTGHEGTGRHAAGRVES